MSDLLQDNLYKLRKKLGIHDLSHVSEYLYSQLEEDLPHQLEARGWHEFWYPHPLEGTWIAMVVLGDLNLEWESFNVSQDRRGYRFMVVKEVAK